MRKWIEFNIRHPKSTLLLLVIITIISFFGLRRLYFDGSSEVMMPKDEIVYKLGERAKKVFGDSRTFLLAAIEPSEDGKLFSHDLFLYLNNLVKEIEEFKDFNYDLENERLNTLVSLGHISFETVKKKAEDKAASKKDGENLEEAFDEAIFEKEADTSKKDNKLVIKNETNDFWDLSKPIVDLYDKPLRERNIYNYEKYEPVSIGKIEQSLDDMGKRELATILRYKGINKDNDVPLTVEEFTKIMEGWETIYLYKSMEIVKTFMNPISGEDILGTKNELKPVDLIEEDDEGRRLIPKTEHDFKIYKAKLLGNPNYDSSLYSMDDNGKFRALAMSIMMKPQKNHLIMYEYLFNMLEKYNHKPMKMTFAGVPIFQAYVVKYMRKDMGRLLPLVLLVIIITFYLNFRLLRGVVIPVIVVILGMLWTMGLMGFSGVPVTMIVNILPTLLIAVASSDSIHIFNQYLHDQKMIHKEGKKAGLIISMNHISLTVFLTSLTTFIGFSTLSISQVMSLRHFGIFAAIGTVVAMAVTVMLIPSALMLLKLLPLKNNENNNGTAHQNIIVQKIVGLFSELSIKHYRIVVGVMVVFIAIFAYGILKINVETAPLFNFKKDSYVYKADMKMSKLFKGTIALNLVIDSGKRNGIKDPEFLKFIEDTRQWLTSEEGKTKYHHLKTNAFSDIIKRMHKAMNNEDPAYYTIPDNEATIRDYLEIYSGEDKDSDGRVDSFEQFVDPEFREANIVLRTGNYHGRIISTNIITDGYERIKTYMATNPTAQKYKWHLVGEPINVHILAERILEGQALTIVLTLIIIGIVMLFLFKNFKASIVSIIPIVTSIIIVYGLMGYLGVPLDTAKCLLSVLTIGIGIDDTIHMLKTLRYYLSKGMSMKDAIAATHKEAGMAIVYTSLAIIFGFSVFMFSEFKPIFYLGWLVSFTMFSTTIAALILLPAVINLLHIDLRSESKSKILQKLDLARIFNLEK